jgi:hypothetical protein
MEQEGMVHALEEIHRLLKPDGCLIDIHPFTGEWFIEVHQRGEILFSEPVPEFDQEDIRQAEDALARVVQHQLFIIENAASFDFLIYASSIVELREYYEEANAFDDSQNDEVFNEWASELAPRVEEAMRAAGVGAEVAYHEWVHITKLKPLNQHITT